MDTIFLLTIIAPKNAVVFETQILYWFRVNASVNPFRSVNGKDIFSVVSAATKQPAYVNMSNTALILQHSWKILLDHDLAEILQTAKIRNLFVE